MLFASLRHFVKMPLKPTLALQLVISNLHLLLLHLLNLLVLIIFALLPNVLVFILSVSLHRYCDPDVVMLKHVDDNMKQAGAKPYTSVSFKFARCRRKTFCKSLFFTTREIRSQ